MTFFAFHIWFVDVMKGFNQKNPKKWIFPFPFCHTLPFVLEKCALGFWLIWNYSENSWILPMCVSLSSLHRAETMIFKNRKMNLWLIPKWFTDELIRKMANYHFFLSFVYCIGAVHCNTQCPIWREILCIIFFEKLQKVSKGLNKVNHVHVLRARVSDNLYKKINLWLFLTISVYFW